MSEALERGWCVLDGAEAVGELLGVYAAPWSLARGELLGIDVPAKLVKRLDTPTGRGTFSDLEISLIKEAP